MFRQSGELTQRPCECRHWHCFITAEFCAPVWERSCHAKKIDAQLNEACRIVTGLLKPTPVHLLHRLAGIVPPNIRRHCQSRVQKFIQETDSRHPLYNHQECQRRLASRNSFMTVERLHPSKASEFKVEKWLEIDELIPNPAVQPPRESLPAGVNLPRRDWVALNRARSGVGRTKDNLCKWGYILSAQCPCGHPEQTMNHILTSCPLHPHCTEEDLLEVTDQALRWIKCWREKI